MNRAQYIRGIVEEMFPSVEEGKGALVAGAAAAGGAAYGLSKLGNFVRNASVHTSAIKDSPLGAAAQGLSGAARQKYMPDGN